MPTQLSISITPGEAPFDPLSFDVATLLPRRDVRRQGGGIGDAPADALAVENSDLDFGHVQPTSVLGRVVELNPPQKGFGLPGTQDFDKGPTEMRVQVVENQMDAAGGGIHRISQMADEADEIVLGALRGHLDLALATLRFDGNEEVAGSGAAVLVILLEQDTTPAR